MNGFWMLGSRLWKFMRERPKTSAAIALGAAVLVLGVWSCQTLPARPARPISIATPTTEPEVRIRVRSGVQTVKLDGPKAFLVKPVRAMEQRLEGPLTLAVTPEGVRIGDAQGKALATLGWGVFEVTGVGEAAASGGAVATPRIRIESSLYPGRLRIFARAGGSMAEAESGRTEPRMDIVTVTGIEDYLVGVVSAELYPDWKNPKVFEVQAVCARTYALHERQRSIDLGQDWDLESTEEDQAYKGGSFKAEAYRGVRDTRGVVLTTNGKLLRTYYSSTCGGRTASAADVWPTGPGYEYNLAPPIQAHPRESMCQISPRFRWEVTRDRTALSKQLRDSGKAKGHPIANLGLFKSLAVEKSNRNGRPSMYKVTVGAGKTYSISAELLRVSCNFRTPGVPAVNKDTLVRSGDLEMEVRGANVLIRGRGFGHGVGMCQFCAKAMADRGDTWQVQVARFYPGAKVERAY